jgi:hypothetical protein
MPTKNNDGCGFPPMLSSEWCELQKLEMAAMRKAVKEGKIEGTSQLILDKADMLIDLLILQRNNVIPSAE